MRPNSKILKTNEHNKFKTLYLYLKYFKTDHLRIRHTLNYSKFLKESSVIFRCSIL
ncbi:hypothetical protein LEP1GSC072_3032 [Leptospira noguchii str. Bonito]|nr:hypothetical protein LEP1GSC072_3032 [Leptospira noguchii str. Bonito]